MEILQLLWLRRFPLANTPQLNYLIAASSSQPPLQNTTELIAPTVLVVNSRHGPHGKHRSSIFPFVSVVAGTCLPNCCPETGCVTPFIKKLLLKQRAFFRDRYPATDLHATVKLKIGFRVSSST
jgi:hypothetical protein